MYKWIIEPKAINASLLMPRMIVSGLNESVVQLVICTDKPVSVKPGLALGMATGVRLSVVGDDNSQVSDDDGDDLFNIGGICNLDTISTGHFSLHGASCAIIDVDSESNINRSDHKDTELPANDDTNPGDGSVRYCRSAETEAKHGNPVNILGAEDYDFVDSLLKTLPPYFSSEQRTWLRDSLLKHIDVFARHENDCGLTN